MSIIECKNLTKTYGKSRGIDNVNLNIEEGEIFGFLGPNGAGKTTTIRVLLGLLKKTSGDAKIFGLDSVKDSIAIRKRVAYLPGELGLYTNLNARQNLKYLLALYDVDVKWSVVEELASRLNLDMNKKVKELSKGNKQKIGNILVLAPDVDLYILDEPTSGLDPLMQMEFHKILHERQEETGSTVFLSSHLLPEVEKVADRVGIIREGKLVETSSIDELKKLSLKTIEIFSKNVEEIVDNLSHIDIHKISKNNSKIQVICPLKSLPLVIKSLDNFTYSDLNITSPSLDDIFMQYYNSKTIGNSKINGGVQ